MIFYLAALQSLPPELQEAAKIEGASRWYFFRRVTFPLLMPHTLFVLVNATINSFKLSTTCSSSPSGARQRVEPAPLLHLPVAFSFFETAYAATLTVVLLALLAALALVQFLLIEKRVHYREDSRHALPLLETGAAWLLRAAVALAARLRVLGRVPPAGVRHPVRAAVAAHAANFAKPGPSRRSRGIS